MQPNLWGAFARSAYRRLPDPVSGALDAWQTRRHGGPDRAPARLDVMTSIGGGNLDVLQVLLRSLVDCHPRDEIRFHLLYLRLHPQRLAELAAFCAGLPNLTLMPLRMPETEDFDRLAQLGGRPYAARFLWFLAHRHLPPDLDRVIFIDPLDTLVTDDLLPLLRHPLLGQYVAACREAPHAPPILAGPARTGGASAARVLRISRGIINSGTMVLNLDRLRRDGVDLSPFLRTAEWARSEHGLHFGDQGLFSLTHGSRYTRLHDRWNHRFHDAGRLRGGRAAAVLHFAGTIPKPFHFRPGAEHEAQIFRALDRSGARAFRLNDQQVIARHDLPHYRRWWQVCARCPVHDRIAGPAAAYAAQVIAAGLSVGDPGAG